MTSFCPPQRFIDQLPTQYVTPKRQAMVAQFLEAAQKADQPLYELLSEVKELAVRVRPDYCEQWLKQSFLTSKKSTSATKMVMKSQSLSCAQTSLMGSSTCWRSSMGIAWMNYPTNSCNFLLLK